MEMLVTKFSKGKYRNESDLFAEPISKDNVKLMGEMIALQLFRTRKKHCCRIADKLYIGLIKDLHHMGEIDYIVSDGYDYAQTAMCFLWQYEGKKVDDVCYTEDNGREISIKLACYRETGNRLDNYRRKMERIALSSSDDYKALPADPVNRFETEEPDYSKAEALMYERHEPIRSSICTRHYHIRREVQKTPHPLQIPHIYRRTLICRLTSYPFERQVFIRKNLPFFMAL